MPYRTDPDRLPPRRSPPPSAVALPAPFGKRLARRASGWRLPRVGLGLPYRGTLSKSVLLGVAGAVIALAGYRMGHGQLLGLGTDGRQAIGYLQIGNDTPGQPFELAVDRVILDVTHSATDDPVPACAGHQSLTEDFESGHFPADLVVREGGRGRAAVGSQLGHEGRYAAMMSVSGGKDSFAYARWETCDVQNLDMSADFWVAREGPSGGNQPLLRVFAPDGTRLVSVYRQNDADDRVFVELNQVFRQTTAHLPLRTWTTVEVRISAPGGAMKRIDVLANGLSVFSASA